MRSLIDRALAAFGYVRSDVFGELIDIQDQIETLKVIYNNLDARALEANGARETVWQAQRSFSAVAGARLDALEASDKVNILSRTQTRQDIDRAFAQIHDLRVGSQEPDTLWSRKQHDDH